MVIQITCFRFYIDASIVLYIKKGRLEDLKSATRCERRTIMNILSRLFSGAALIALASTAANATSIIGYSATQGASTNSNFSLTLNKFDTGLGTLSAVTIYFAATLNETNITITSTDASNTDMFDYQVTDNVTKTFVNSAVAADKLGYENLQVFDTGEGLALGSCGATGGTTTVQPNNGCNPITLGPDATTGNFGPYSVSDTNAIYGLTTGTGTNGLLGVTISGSVLTAYEAAGGGTFTITGTTQGSSGGDQVGSGSTNDTVTNTSTTQFAAEVDYSYSAATPEPGTMMLLGSALVGLGLIRRSRSKKA